MKPHVARWLAVSLAIVAALFLVACPPTVDPTLSPPVIDKPLYTCAEVIAFSGADRDAKITVYVNGSQVTEVPIWMGWGSIKLPSALHTGDVVTAAQVVGSRISDKTRDAVTVITVPATLAPQGKLAPPTVVPPLYECQRVVRVKNVLQGAEVILRNSDATTWKTMTPYTVARFGLPELKLGDWYNAMQSLCKDKPYQSGWSAKETVGKKPATLSPPKVHEPLVAGSDACRLDDLVPGATVKIFADPGTGKVQVGGGTALESATIFKINPPIDAASKYSATQALCELESPSSDPTIPLKDPPAPTIKEPLCQGGKYVTVCDTTVLSTVKVLMNGTQVAQGAGNGGCVTLALGDATLLQTGKKLSAVQVVAGHTSPASATVVVGADAAPAYNPAPWNSATHRPHNNCYNYGCDIMTDTYAQPGKAHGVFPPTTCAGTGSGAQADGLTNASEKGCSGCKHLVAMVISPGTSGGQTCGVDYHWYRRDSNGRWSHKPGPGYATDRDASGNQITNPETADRKYVGPDYCWDYSVFCTYYCVDKSVVVIQ